MKCELQVISRIAIRLGAAHGHFVIGQPIVFLHVGVEQDGHSIQLEGVLLLGANRSERALETSMVAFECRLASSDDMVGLLALLPIVDLLRLVCICVGEALRQLTLGWEVTLLDEAFVRFLQGVVVTAPFDQPALRPFSDAQDVLEIIGMRALQVSCDG